MIRRLIVARVSPFLTKRWQSEKEILRKITGDFKVGGEGEAEDTADKLEHSLRIIGSETKC